MMADDKLVAINHVIFLVQLLSRLTTGLQTTAHQGF